MRRVKYKEANVPDHLMVRVRYVNERGVRWFTSCHLIDRETEAVVATGGATCSIKDQPVRKIGRAIAVGRAIKNYYEGGVAACLNPS